MTEIDYIVDLLKLDISNWREGHSLTHLVTETSIWTANGFISLSVENGPVRPNLGIIWPRLKLWFAIKQWRKDKGQEILSKLLDEKIS